MNYKGQKNLIALVLVITMIFTSIGSVQPVFAAEDEGVEVSVRIESYDKTKLQYTELSVNMFDIAPFITGSVEGFVEPTYLVTGHALIEAIYYSNFGEDPTDYDLSVGGGLTEEKINRIKEDLLISNSDYGLSVDSIFKDKNLIMSVVNNVSGFGIGSDQISNGDEIVFYPYAIGSWGEEDYVSLNYAYFNTTHTTVKKDEFATLHLNNIEFDQNFNSSIKPVTGAAITINGQVSQYITDDEGTVKIDFSKAGEYIISALKGNSNNITKPYCKVVVENEPGEGENPGEDNSPGKEDPQDPGEQEPSHDLDITISNIIESIATMNKSYTSDWITSMSSAGKSNFISEESKTEFVKTVLNESRKANLNLGNISKMIIALTSLGIDPTIIPDEEGNNINLVHKLSNAKTIESLGSFGYYTAPYILLAYDAGEYEVTNTAPLSRNNVIEYLLSLKDKWRKDVDAASMVLTPLAPYYLNTELLEDEVLAENLVATVNQTIAWLSQQQTSSGSFKATMANENSNSTAMTIVALSAIGINSHEDSRFIKENSAIEGLLSFKTDDHRFGFTNNKYNAMSTLQGFQAIIAYNSLTSGNENGGNIYKFNKELVPYEWPEAESILDSIIVTNHPLSHKVGNKLKADDLTVVAKYIKGSTEEKVQLDASEYTISDYDYNATGAKTVEVNFNSKKASFIVTVTEDVKDGPIIEVSKVSLRVKSANGKVIFRESNLPIIKNETTALEILKTVLGRSGYFVKTDASGSYVESIDGLGEFGLGKNSGWLYSVNGTTPSTTSASDYTLNNGDVVEWYFTEDFTKDESSSAWRNENAVKNNIEVKDNGKGKVTVDISKEDLKNIMNENNELTIESRVAAINFDKRALNEILKKSGNKININISLVEDSKDKLVYEFEIKIGSKSISSFDTSNIKISIPYEPTMEKDLNAIVVYYINEDGSEEVIKNSVYNIKNNAIEFNSNQLSKLVVKYNYIEFEDVENHWSRDNITFLASREIIKGKEPGVFMPDEGITRAELVTILANKYGADLTKNYNSSEFDDVNNGDWYASVVGWANEKEIVKGFDGKFRPNDKVTRQEMAVILERYITNIGKFSLDKNTALKFSDENEIADYAKESVCKMQQYGIINGKTTEDFVPLDNTTRGEVAKIITSLIKSI